MDKKIIGVFILTPILMLLNPHGIYGLLYPLNIFTNYGYTIVENQNIFFLHEVTSNQNITYFFFLLPCVIVSIGVLYARKKVFEVNMVDIIFSSGCL